MIAYNSCRNRHCPKCQGAAAKDWLAARQAELLPVEYYHVVFTLPAPIADIAYQNKAAIYGILFKAAAETLITIAADPKHLGARIGLTAVLHTWGSALTHHPHVHCVVPGGGISLDGERWVSCRPGFFLPVRVLSRLFRRLFLEKLAAAHEAGRLRFFGNLRHLADARPSPPSFAVAQDRMGGLRQTPLRRARGRARLSIRYTHRVAISNSRLITLDDKGVTFKWKDYRAKGRDRQKVMTLGHQRVHPPLPHSRLAPRLPPHPPLRALCQWRAHREPGPRPSAPLPSQHHSASSILLPMPMSRRCSPIPAQSCGGPMIIIETFERGSTPRAANSPRAPPARKAHRP